MSTNNRQCYSDRRDREPIPPPKIGGTGGSKKSTIRNRETERVDFRGGRASFATTISRGAPSKPQYVISFRGQRLLKTAARPPQIRQPQY
jgi:hypothetical protein